MKAFSGHKVTRLEQSQQLAACKRTMATGGEAKKKTLYESISSASSLPKTCSSISSTSTQQPATASSLDTDLQDSDISLPDSTAVSSDGAALVAPSTPEKKCKSSVS